MAPAAILAGVAIAPTLIAGFTLVQKLVPSEALTEGLNWTITALGVGAAVGAWTAGLIADNAGGKIAFLVAVAAGSTAVIMAAWGRSRLLTLWDKGKESIQRWQSPTAAGSTAF
jgi:MFS family permease